MKTGEGRSAAELPSPAGARRRAVQPGQVAAALGALAPLGRRIERRYLEARRCGRLQQQLEQSASGRQADGDPSGRAGAAIGSCHDAS